MEENVRIEQLEPVITETKLWNLNNFFLAFFIGIGFAVLAIVLMTIFNLNLVGSLILVLVIVVVYASILFFLLESRILREVEQTTLKTIERSFIKEVPFEKKVFIDRPVIKEVQVEKEVIVEKPVVREVYIPLREQKDKIIIPKYNFVASTEARTYHKRNCRFGKLIKKKYKVSNNFERSFIRKGFKPCKVCITKEKKA